MSALDFYRAQAAQAEADAAAATLSNVRDRCARSAAAWADMAHRAEKTEAMRVAREEDKAGVA